MSICWTEGNQRLYFNQIDALAISNSTDVIIRMFLYLRALATRYIGTEDFLHMPPWNSQWYLQQVRQNDIDGVIYVTCQQRPVSSGRFHRSNAAYARLRP